MTSQPPFVPGFALPMSSPFEADHSASPRTRQPVSVEPLKDAVGLEVGRIGGAQAERHCHQGRRRDEERTQRALHTDSYLVRLDDSAPLMRVGPVGPSGPLSATGEFFGCGRSLGFQPVPEEPAAPRALTNSTKRTNRTCSTDEVQSDLPFALEVSPEGNDCVGARSETGSSRHGSLKTIADDPQVKGIQDVRRSRRFERARQPGGCEIRAIEFLRRCPAERDGNLVRPANLDGERLGRRAGRDRASIPPSRSAHDSRGRSRRRGRSLRECLRSFRGRSCGDERSKDFTRQLVDRRADLIGHDRDRNPLGRDQPLGRARSRHRTAVPDDRVFGPRAVDLPP